MLRALASYFFGGIEDESPEAPIECETREVNDWLVVNLPDHLKDSVYLNDDDDTYEIDDEEVRNAMDEDDPVEVDESDIDEMDLEDDILLSLSFLMPPETEQLSTELSNNEFVYERRALEQPPCLSKYSEPFTAPNYLYKHITDSNRRMFLAKMVRESISPRESITNRMMDYFSCVKLDDSHKEALLDLVIPRLRERQMRENIVNELERQFKVPAQVSDFTSPPMYSKNYVNHRHPEKLFNQDLLQRIKELEPEQQAMQWSVKKNLTRGQLTRQNKNYMYETSSKKNRRCNRQRNHSGANNNRKC